MNQPAGNQVILNVGGIIFETTRQTLSGSAYFHSLLSNWTPSGTGPYFIDRSYILFEHVLCLLRDPSYDYPSEYNSELDFYGINYEPIALPPPQIPDELDMTEIITILKRLKEESNLCSVLKCPFVKVTMKYCAYCSPIGPSVLLYTFPIHKSNGPEIIIKHEDKLRLINRREQNSVHDDDILTANFSFSSCISEAPRYVIPFEEITLPTYQEADMWLNGGEK